MTWLFVAGHRPYLSSDKSEYDSHKPGAPLLHYLEPLFAKYQARLRAAPSPPPPRPPRVPITVTPAQVDMVLTGHMHCYEVCGGGDWSGRVCSAPS